MSAQELADWLADFWFCGGNLSVTCNGMGILAEDGEGRNWFTINGYTDDELATLFDRITPYL